LVAAARDPERHVILIDSHDPQPLHGAVMVYDPFAQAHEMTIWSATCPALRTRRCAHLAASALGAQVTLHAAIRFAVDRDHLSGPPARFRGRGAKSFAHAARS
jgi:hypothetical protein